MPSTKPDVPHYAMGRIEPIDFMEGSFTPEEYWGYLKGNIIKYISRYRYKGTPLADLHKARTYLDWLCEAAEAEAGADCRRGEVEDAHPNPHLEE